MYGHVGDSEEHAGQDGRAQAKPKARQAVHGQPDVRTFPPGIEDAFMIGWDGTIGPACGNKNQAPPGSYLVVAKLDTKVSDPVPFTVG